MSTPFGVIPQAQPPHKVFMYCADVYAYPSLSFRPYQFVMVAVSEDGDVLGSHYCDDPSFAMGDLHNRRPVHAAYAAKFGGWGDGRFYRVVEIPVGELPPEPVMRAIRRKNAAAGEAVGD